MVLLRVLTGRIHREKRANQRRFQGGPHRNCGVQSPSRLPDSERRVDTCMRYTFEGHKDMSWNGASL